MVNVCLLWRLSCLAILLYPLMGSCVTKNTDLAVRRALPKLETSIQQMMKAHGIPGMAVAIVSKDKVYYLNTFGVKRIGYSDKINNSTLFQIASLSKPIHATMVGILHDQGKLSLDDPLSTHIAFKRPQGAQTLKIHHVLSHSTGLPIGAFNNMIESRTPREEIIAKLQRARAIAAPGQKFTYHNAMYGVVDDVISSAAGASSAQTLKKNLFSPLGMQHVTMGYHSLMQTSNRAYPHIPNGRGKYMPATGYSSSYYTFLAAGGVNASIQDLVPFLQLYLGKPSPIVSQKTLKQLVAPFVKNPGAVIVHEAPKGKIKDTYYGLGWHSMSYAHNQIVYHQGHLKGFRHFMGYLPDEVGIIILTNAEKKHASKVALKFFDAYLNT